MSNKKLGIALSSVVIGLALLGAIFVPVLAEDGPGQQSASDASSNVQQPYVHYRMPPRAMIESRLREAGRISAESSETEIQTAVNEWLFKFAKASPSWVHPEDYEEVLENERQMLDGDTFRIQAAKPITAFVLAIPVEFSATETLTLSRPISDYTACEEVTEVFTGPLHGNIPYPGGNPTDTIDNNTAYYPSTEPEDYEKLIFGRTGITENLRAGDPNVNNGAGVDISGLTVQTYYDAQSDNSVVVTGTVAPWVPVTHTEAYYGADQCVPGSEPPATADGQLGRPADLVVEAAKSLKDQGGEYATYDFWKQFDDDDDGFIDTLWIIHAGRGQEAGGGAEGEDAIWSHSSDLTYYTPYQDGYVIHNNGTPTTTDDIKIGPFTFQPEDGDLGVFTEEFGHNYFDFPDLYTLDAPNSVGWWSHMSAGSWGGELGGTRPVNMPLWFRMVADCAGTSCGWADPIKTLSYTTAMTEVVIGQAGEPAGGTTGDGDAIYEGVRIKLPDREETVPNSAGSGKGMHSTSGNMMENTLDRAVDLSEASAPITLTVGAYWDIEENWDYGYVEVSTDTVSFTSIDDLDGILRESNPNGNNQGHGLTGAGQGTLRFDLSAYAGEEITLRFRYSTDPAVANPGWWIDDVEISGGLFSEDFEGDLSSWTNNGWKQTPYTLTYPHYYLVEWRNDNDFDESLNTPYNTNYMDQDEWRVDRVPANVPGAVVMYRNTKYDFSYSLLPQTWEPPSVGSKYGLLVVDTNFWPVEPMTATFSGRLQSLDAPLALQDQDAFTLTTRSNPTKTLESTETISGAQGVDTFNDAYGYYPGFYMGGDCPSGYVCYWDQDASVVIPSREGKTYSTRITDADKNPLTSLYGTSVGGFPLGSGDPGDDNAQFGLHIELVEKASDGSWGKIKIWNGAVGITPEPSTSVILGDETTDLDYQTIFENQGYTDTTVVATYTLPSEFVYEGGTAEGNISASDFDFTHEVVWTGVISAGKSMTVTLDGHVTPKTGQADVLATYLEVDDGFNPTTWKKTILTELNPHSIFLPTVLRE